MDPQHHPVVPGLIAALVPILLLPSERIEMSQKTLALFFPERASAAQTGS